MLGLCALASLSSCMATEAMYNDRVHDIRYDLTYQNDFTDACILNFKDSKKRMELLSKVYGVPEMQVPKTFCKRFVGGLKSGQLSYEDLKTIHAEKKFTPKTRKILFGK